MMKRRYPWQVALLFVLFFSVILLVSCTGNQISTCGPDALQFPGKLTPNDIVVDASKPLTLSWVYTDTTCRPDHYEVTLGTDYEGGSPVASQTTSDTSLDWPGTLKPGKTYFWRVAPVTVSNGETHKGPSQLAAFYTGPMCSPDLALQAPRLVYPPDNATIDPTNGFSLRWEDPSGCLPDGDYYTVIAKSADFSSVVYADRRGTMSELSMYPSWAATVEDCTRYYWRVMADISGPQDGPWSETWSFVINKTGSACALSVVNPTLSPETPTPLSPTPVPSPTYAVPILTAKMNVMCRLGPSSLEYPGVDVLFIGWSAWIRGRNPDSTWWYIHRPNMPDYCWVWGGAIEVTGDTSEVPIVKPPPPSTETPEPTLEPTPSG